MDEKQRQDSPRNERGMSASEYWDRLTRSFTADYMKTVEKKYGSLDRF